ncbi:8-amino-7-oxononanoate synthase [Desulfonatronospira sp.]|uniref:8-amino-7-oxononanoate synthase n=1 Tax=Desulfonatronospira sp. TaxID=1962951 RepID=UPI0025BFAD89|nr:8-amino-7-oxononanoate synthase [Desulfonatronospira sp.]
MHNSTLQTFPGDPPVEELRSIPEIDHGPDLYLQYRGQRLLNLASNNYLGLAGSQSMKKAALQAVEKFGASSGASRLISGNYSLYTRLEETLCRFKETQASLVFGSGYAANLGILSALAHRKCLIFSDRLNHASIIDGIILSRATHIRYRHADVEHLSYLLQKQSSQAPKILITDTVFSMDGDRASLIDIVELCKKHKVMSIVDEAHATGVLGRGKGLAGELGLNREIDLHMGTFSKALGSYGGYAACSRAIRELLVNRARSFIYSTSLPPAVTGACLEGLQQVLKNPEQGRKLLDIARDFRSFLQNLGFDTLRSTTQIIPVIMHSSTKTLQAQKELMQSGIYVAAVRPPTVPAGSARLRLSLRADMGDKEIEMARQALINLSCRKFNNERR